MKLNYLYYSQASDLLSVSPFQMLVKAIHLLGNRMTRLPPICHLIATPMGEQGLYGCLSIVCPVCRQRVKRCRSFAFAPGSGTLGTLHNFGFIRASVPCLNRSGQWSKPRHDTSNCRMPCFSYALLYSRHMSTEMPLWPPYDHPISDAFPPSTPRQTGSML